MYKLIQLSVLQAEFLATAKAPPARIPVGTVVRIADGLETCGPLRAGQTAITIAEDGSSNPYRVRTADGEEHGYWFELDKLVEADAAASVSWQSCGEGESARESGLASKGGCPRASSFRIIT